MLPFLAISAGLHLAVAFGFAYSSYNQTVTVPADSSLGTPSRSITVALAPKADVSESDVNAGIVSTPADAPHQATGDLLLKVGRVTSGNVSTQPADQFTATAANVAELVSIMRTHDFEGVQTTPVGQATQFGTSLGYSTSVSTNPTSYALSYPGAGARIILRYSQAGSTTKHYIAVPTSGISCPAGYVYNAQSTHATNRCELNSRPDAFTPGSINGVCTVNAFGQPNAADPDCQAVLQSGHLQQKEDGTVQVLDNPVEPSLVTSYTPPAAADQPATVSVLERTSTGGFKRQDAPVSTETGTVGAATTTYYPSTPPPAYPGDTAGVGSNPGIPGGTVTVGGGGGSTCGGPSQPPCQVQFAGDTDMGTPGAIGEEQDSAGAFAELKDAINPFSGLNLPAGQGTCEPLSVDIPGFGQASDDGFMCNMLAQVKPIASAIFKLAYILAGIIIILGA